MKKNIVTVKTITIGLKGKKLLNARGIKSGIVKIDSTRSETGCQYGLEFYERDFYEAISILKDHGISYGVYKQK